MLFRSSKVIQRSDYVYDDTDPPEPDHVRQYDVSRIADPPAAGGVLESTINYENTPFQDPSEPRIKDIVDKHGNTSTYSYHVDNAVDTVVQTDKDGIKRSEIVYERGPFFNDRVLKTLTYKDDPGSVDPMDVILDEQLVYSYDENSKVKRMQRFRIINGADTPVFDVNGNLILTDGHIVDDELLSETLFENEVPQVEFSYRWIDDDETPVTPDVQLLVSYSVLNYEADGRTANYSDSYAVLNGADVTPQKIQDKIDESTVDAIDTIKEAIDALLADDLHKTRVFFNDLGTRAEYSISLNKDALPVSLSVFHYDDAPTADGDLVSIDQWNISEEGQPLPSDSSGVVIPADVNKELSTVFFNEDGDRTEYVHNYKYDGATQSVISYNIFNYDENNKSLLKSTDSYFAVAGADINAAAIQAKIDEFPADAIDTIREAMEAILADAPFDDDITGRTFLDEQQSPLLAIAVNAAGEISGFSTFAQKPDGTLAYVNSHRLVDQNTSAPGLQKILWSALADNLKNEDADFGAGQYELSLDTGLASRTYLDVDGNPEVSVSINSDYEVSGISTFKVSPRGEIIFVNSHRLLDQDTSTEGLQRERWDLLSFASKDEAADMIPYYNANLDTGVSGRTYLFEGNPKLSVAVNTLNEISGISTFAVDERGDISYVNSHRLVDQDSTTAGLQRVSWADALFQKDTDLDGKFEISLDTGLTGRTFLENGDPKLSVAINSNNEISGFSSFNLDEFGVIQYVNSHRLVDQDTSAPGLQRTGWSDAAYQTATSLDTKYQGNLDTGLSGRTYLKDGNPSLSVAINSLNQTAGFSTFKVNDDGDILYVNSHRVVDQDTSTSGLQRAVWTSSAYEEDTDLSGLYENSLDTGLTGRTYLSSGDPVLSVAINSVNEVSGISSFAIDESGDIVYVNSHRLVDQDTSVEGLQRTGWADALYSSETSLASLYEASLDTGISGRTYLENGDPSLSVAINNANEIAGFSTFEINENGDIQYVNSHRVVDQDTSAAGLQRAGWTSAAYQSSASLSGKYETDLNFGLTGRTYLVNGDPALSVSINSAQEISGISTFQVNGSGDIEFVNSHRLTDQDTSAPGLQRAGWDSTLYLQYTDLAGKYQADLASGLTGRTFLKNGDPVLSVAINSLNEISGVSSFALASSGDIDYVNSHRLIDQDSTAPGLQ